MFNIKQIVLIPLIFGLSSCYFSHYTQQVQRQQGAALCEIRDFESLELVSARRLENAIAVWFQQPHTHAHFRAMFTLGIERSVSGGLLEEREQLDLTGGEVPVLSLREYEARYYAAGGVGKDELFVVEAAGDLAKSVKQRFLLVSGGRTFGLSIYSPTNCAARDAFDTAMSPVKALAVIVDIVTLPVRAPLGLRKSGM